ncbi:unnamed protein product, partial [Didymodactylos carnosus]
LFSLISNIKNNEQQLIEQDNDYVINLLITILRLLHQTSLDERHVDLTAYIQELFQSVEDLFSNKYNKQFGLTILKSLTQLLKDYNDRQALKIEFLKGNCLKTIEFILSKQNNSHVICIILLFIIKFIYNSENVRQSFFDYGGYEKIFNSLYYIETPTMEFINELIELITETTTVQILYDNTMPIFNSSSSSSIIDLFIELINPHIVISLIHWLPHIKIIEFQQKIVYSLNLIFFRSLQNKMIACSNGIVMALIQILDNNQQYDKIVLGNE